MLKTLKIENFESHIDAELNFDKGVNVIIGKSDNGKSALMRSIYWNLINFPKGESYRTWESDETTSKLIFNDVITKRIRSNTKNAYECSEFKETFNAIGNGDPPEDIQKLLNIDRNINIHMQSDPIFLLSQSPGEVARHFNKVAGLFKIDSTLKNATQDINKTKSKINALKDNIENAKEDLKNYEYLDFIGPLIQKGEIFEESIKKSLCSAQKLKSIIDKVHVIKVSIIKKKKEVKPLELIKQALIIDEKIKNLDIKIKKLKTLISNISDLNQKIKNNTESVKIKSSVVQCLSIQKGIQKITQDIIKYKKYISQINAIKTNKALNKKYLINYKQKFKELMPDVCPLCGK